MANLFASFLRLLPQTPLLIGEVLSVDGEVATVELPDGSRVLARGAALAGDKVFVRDGAIEGQAPSLAPVAVTL